MNSRKKTKTNIFPEGINVILPYFLPPASPERTLGLAWNAFDIYATMGLITFSSGI